MYCSGAILRRLASIVAVAGGLFASGPAVNAALLLDHSGLTVTSGYGTILGGNWVGFEFTTPSGPSFELGEIRAAFTRPSGYVGDTDFQLFTRSGADLTAFSSRVTIADSGIFSGNILTYDFSTDAVIVDFSSQSLMLSPSTTYSLMAEHNGSGSFDSLWVRYQGGDPISDAVVLSASASLDDALLQTNLDAAFQLFDTTPVPEPASAFLLGFTALFFGRFRRTRAAALLSAIAMLLFTSGPARAALVLDESGVVPNGILSTNTGGNWRGFEFTTGGSAFDVGIIKGAWYQNGAYTGDTDIQLFERSGLNLTAISTPVTVSSLSTASLLSFDFATHAVTVDFSSQTITLSANTAYTILAEHNGSASGFLGVYRNNTDPISDSGRVQASASLNDALYLSGEDIPFQVYDTPPVPEPSSLLLFFAAQAALLARRRR